MNPYLAQEKIINIYTDSKYTYNIIHSNIPYLERKGILNPAWKPHHKWMLHTESP
jgi:hypothetical protein